MIRPFLFCYRFGVTFFQPIFVSLKNACLIFSVWSILHHRKPSSRRKKQTAEKLTRMTEKNALDVEVGHASTLWTLPSLKLTAGTSKIGRAPKGNNRLPTIHFQELLLLVSGRVSLVFLVILRWDTLLFRNKTGTLWWKKPGVFRGF